MRARLRIKTTQIPPLFPVFQYSNLSFPYLTYIPYISLHILVSFAHCSHFQLAELQKKLAGERSIVVFFFFLIFVCIKGYPSLAPKKENFMMESVETKIA